MITQALLLVSASVLITLVILVGAYKAGHAVGIRSASKRMEASIIHPSFIGTWNEEGNFHTEETLWYAEGDGGIRATAKGRHEKSLIDEWDVISLRGDREVSRIQELRRQSHFKQWEASCSR